MQSKIKTFLKVAGPGLVVMLADTDAGSLITASQSGAVTGYKLLSLQVILIPILCIVQELAVRLGLSTNKGHGELIKLHYGTKWAWISVSTLIISCIGAILSEFSGIIGVGQLFGIEAWQTMAIMTPLLLILVCTGSYRSVEKIIIFFGLMELIFIYAAYKSHPSLLEIKNNLLKNNFGNKSYLYLFVGNIGAVIMPWMIFYQQSAIVDKGLVKKHFGMERLDMIIGAVITQIIMASMLILTAATINKTNPNAPLNNVYEISQALIPALGETKGKIIFAAGMLGASLISTVVVCLTASWSIGEIIGFKRSLANTPKEAPHFYAIYSLIIIIGAIMVGSERINLVNLSVGINVMNALLLPIVLCFLFLLAKKSLSKDFKLGKIYERLVCIVFIIVSATSIFCAISSIYA